MSLRFLTSGESHGPALNAILEGIPAGLMLSAEMIDVELMRRQKGYGSGPRMKLESDSARILAGVMEGVTTGSPISLMIENRDHAKWKNRPIPPFTTPRPGHVDLAGTLKYGYRDLRPALERASARETAARVAVGAVCKHFLRQFDIHVGGYVVAIGAVSANVDDIPLEARATLAEQNDVRCPDLEAAEAMRQRIAEVMQQRDTLGGVLEVYALGVPAGLGSHVHWDRRLEVSLGGAALSVPAVKGVEIGAAFENSRLLGTQAQDPIRLEGDGLVRRTTRNGGLEGGITTGQPMLLRAAMKPIATTLTPQQSVDLASGEEVMTQYERSDFCPVPRAVPILEAVVAYVLADALLEKLGGDSLEEMRPRFESLRKARLGDLRMDPSEHLFWPEE